MSGDLPWKDTKRLSSMRPTLEWFWCSTWGNLWEMGLSTCELFWVCVGAILNWTELQYSSLQPNLCCLEMHPKFDKLRMQIQCTTIYYIVQLPLSRDMCNFQLTGKLSNLAKNAHQCEPQSHSGQTPLFDIHHYVSTSVGTSMLVHNVRFFFPFF